LNVVFTAQITMYKGLIDVKDIVNSTM